MVGRTGLASAAVLAVLVAELRCLLMAQMAARAARVEAWPFMEVSRSRAASWALAAGRAARVAFQSATLKRIILRTANPAILERT